MTDSRWWWGVVFNACGSLALNFGSNIIKLGHYRRATASEPTSPSVGGATPKRRYFREWAIGMLLFAGGNVLNFLSFGYAAQSMLAPLGSIQFVSNLLFALIFARDTVSRNSLTSIGVIAIGCTLIVLFGSHHSQHYTAKELVAMYRPLPYVLYLSIGASLVVLFYILLLVSKRRARRPTGEEHKIWAFLLLVSYSVFSALPGSQAVLFSKSLSSLARATASGSSQAAHWYTWVLVPLFIGTAMWWVTRLNKGLQTFPPVVLVPTMQCAWMMFAVISGLIYFDEYISFNTTRAVLYCFGLLVRTLPLLPSLSPSPLAATPCCGRCPTRPCRLAPRSTPRGDGRRTAQEGETVGCAHAGLDNALDSPPASFFPPFSKLPSQLPALIPSSLPTSTRLTSWAST